MKHLSIYMDYLLSSTYDLIRRWTSLACSDKDILLNTLFQVQGTCTQSITGHKLDVVSQKTAANVDIQQYLKCYNWVEFNIILFQLY